MPNWCTNKLTVFGPAADVKQFKAQAVGYSPWWKEEQANVLNFHSLVPIPHAVLAAGYEDAGDDWERAHWGCKWGACNAAVVDEGEGHLVYTFATAWSPPIEFLKTIGPQWSTLTYVLEYEELGVGFKGLCKVKGQTVEDHCLTL
jgi:hypothetical protein